MPTPSSPPTRLVSGEDLHPGVPHRGPFTVTPNFLAAWGDQDIDEDTRRRIVAVMHGVTKEPRHPAYRVTTTNQPNTYTATVGVTNPHVLVFHADPFGSAPTWVDVDPAASC